MPSVADPVADRTCLGISSPRFVDQRSSPRPVCSVSRGSRPGSGPNRKRRQVTGLASQQKRLSSPAGSLIELALIPGDDSQESAWPKRRCSACGRRRKICRACSRRCRAFAVSPFAVRQIGRLKHRLARSSRPARCSRLIAIVSFNSFRARSTSPLSACKDASPPSTLARIRARKISKTLM